jgi:hypothetical protein
MDDSFEEYVKRLEAEGYIAPRDGAPLKCLWCDSKRLDEKRYYEDYIMTEKKVFCLDCGKETGSWNYGHWDL